jgi:hypothetical protein
MPKSKALTITQLLILTTAAQRPDHMVLPLPATIRARGGARRNLISPLLKMELVEELPVSEVAVAWRTDEAAQHHGLRITPAGLTAAGAHAGAAESLIIEPGDQEQVAGANGVSAAVEEASAERAREDVSPRRPIGKLGKVLQAISADAGATLTEITTLTGWLPHSARAAVTGLRKRGYGVALIQQNGRKAYRMTMAD